MSPYRFPDVDRSNMKKEPVFYDHQLVVEECEICHGIKDVKKRKVLRKDNITKIGYLCDKCVVPMKNVETLEVKVFKPINNGIKKDLSIIDLKKKIDEISKENDSLSEGDSLLI